MYIEITTNHSASSYGKPVVLVDGKLVDITSGVQAAYEAIKDMRIKGFFGLPTTLAVQNDPLPYIARAEKAEKQYRELAAAVRIYYRKATGYDVEETAGGNPVEMMDDLMERGK